jgi:2,3-bisphosphoglycerate-independent phosphoglycerate mutase
MSAYELTDAVIKELQENKYDTMILNYANPDMVGHTGSIEAATKAVEVVDECLGKIYEQVNKMNGTLIIIADHGNAEVMRTEAGEPHTAHTSNIVPIIITDKNVKIRDNGALCDIAPTMLKMLDLKQPKEMTGESLI